ncbi:hypothetical protein [Chamaesiphon polymorphus]|nr:hypothetical protein [Chamaesiphon polymorphus]
MSNIIGARSPTVDYANDCKSSSIESKIDRLPNLLVENWALLN